MQRLLNSPWEDVIHPVIAIIEDSDEDFYSFLRATQKLHLLERSLYNIVRFQDGDEALDYLFRQGNYQGLQAPLPVAILLDLNLPNTDGREVIYRVKQSSHLQPIPIIVLTTSNSYQDIQTCYRYGANCYMLKPLGVSEMQQTVQVIFQHWFQVTLLPSYGQFSA
ncbi:MULTISPECIES: response regulator [Pseudanabaena]|uniref:Response regulator receiver protein n=2 Tax=Pseudanabaena TaxID=1152 RepID=L8MSY4_9CYAN|nr:MULTISPECIES: response regulator [Pseudanabaena]ELS31042.1 response regulator receiver protein [Pseudanabaena biceps PCC 7429]MDG3496691.1 response regulator [Pseudanabaena catenata USMAC16]